MSLLANMCCSFPCREMKMIFHDPPLNFNPDGSVNKDRKNNFAEM